MIKDLFKDTEIAKAVRPGFVLFEYLFTPGIVDRIFSAALSRGGEFTEIFAEFSIINGIVVARLTDGQNHP